MVTKNLENFTNLILNFDPKNSIQKKELENIIFKFPYFQLAHAIYLKSLKIQDPFNFDLILKKTAILSSKRKLIFNWIEENENNLFDIIERSVENITKESKEIDNPIRGISTNNKSIEDEQKMLFVDWVMSYKDSKKESEDRPLESKIEIIDSFIEKNPKIKKSMDKVEEDNFLNLASDNKFDKSVLMTETLAKIYVKQNKIKKALYAYKILSLKYPKKSSFFADQIIYIKKLKSKD